MFGTALGQLYPTECHISDAVQMTTGIGIIRFGVSQFCRRVRLFGFSGDSQPDTGQAEPIFRDSMPWSNALWARVMGAHYSYSSS